MTLLTLPWVTFGDVHPLAFWLLAFSAVGFFFVGCDLLMRALGRFMGDERRWR